MSEALVSVILPTYNRAQLTKRALLSVLAQSYSQLEIFIVDDGSEPSQQIDFSSFNDSRIYYHSIPHSGVSAARNAGINKSTGSLIALLDSDDEWMPQKIARQVELLESNADISLCHTEEEWIRRGRRVNPRQIHKKADGEAFASCVSMCCISPSAAMIRRELFSEIGLFDEAMRVCEDYDLWLRFTANHRVALISEPLVRKYGGHQDQLSQSEPAIDRFRVFALCKLLIAQKLSLSQIELVQSGIAQRLSVLCLGAEKRENLALISLCVAIENAIKVASITELEQVYTQLIEVGIVK